MEYEASGPNAGAIALCSKTYIVYQDDGGESTSEVDGQGDDSPEDNADCADEAAEEAARARLKQCKIAAKGIQQRLNASQLTIQNFKNALHDSKPIIGTNRGFVCKADGVYTYETKRSVQGIYLKRRVAENMCDTSVLHDLAVDAP